MGRLFFLAAMCTVLCACGKKSNPAPSTETVEYRFVAAPGTSFRGTYVNEQSVAVDTGFYGTAFSKTIKVTKASGFTFAELSFAITDNSASGSGTVYILVNGNIVLQQYVDFAYPKTGFDCKTQVF